MSDEKKDCCEKKHLCDLMSEKDGIAEVREAAKDPRFICKACGRAAREAQRLCVPVELNGKP